MDAPRGSRGAAPPGWAPSWLRPRPVRGEVTPLSSRDPSRLRAGDVRRDFGTRGENRRGIVVQRAIPRAHPLFCTGGEASAAAVRAQPDARERQSPCSLGGVAPLPAVLAPQRMEHLTSCV